MSAFTSRLPLDVSRETEHRLEHLVELVRKWSPRINLVSRQDLADLWTRHVADSAQLWLHAPTTARRSADLGSGGGFPGLVIACIAADAAPAMRVSLVEADHRKAAFLRTAARELDLACDIHAQRIEDVAPLQAGIVSARALMPLDRLLEAVHRHLRPDGLALLPKGRSVAAEIDRARRLWSFDLEDRPSLTDPEGRILMIERIAPCPR